MGKLTYNQIYEKSSIVKNIPIMFEGRTLPKGMSARVVLVRVQYDKYVDAFEKEMEEVQKDLKKDGFDDRMGKVKRMESIDDRKAKAESWEDGQTDDKGNPVEKPAMPSDEELKEADEIRKTSEDFYKELETLNEEYMQARIARSSDEVEISERKFSVDDLSEIIAMIGEDDGTIEVNGNNIAKELFINVIGSKFCE